MNKCLYCYQLLGTHGSDFHISCSKKFFDSAIPPTVPYTEEHLEPLAMQIIQRQTALTGVQPKLSLHLSGNKETGIKPRLTLAGLWGGYILKPPSTSYPQLPEVEDLTMHLAAAARINTAPHSLIRMQAGHLAFITKRIDRTRKGKLAMEDMCQLTERLTEDKYQGSYEQVGKAILKYSTSPGLDLVNFFELLLFI